MIDLRSDTVTRPGKKMLEAMTNAAVGDDVYMEDPTVSHLEKLAAEMFGKEAALFAPSGIMTNQLALKVHTVPGDEIICHRLSHIYNFEGGGAAFHSASSVRLLDGNNGRFTATDVLNNINPIDVHYPVTRVVAVENTTNKGGGAIWDFEELKKIGSVCRENKLAYHIDGARLFNALVETKETPADYGKLFDSISICLSKGLGAPVGSLLIGSNDFIFQARRWRRVFGGGMRQAGFIAAAGIYALENHVERLRDDHQRARKLADTIEKLSFVDEVLPVSSNIVIFRLNDSMSEQKFLRKLAEEEILAVKFGRQTIRMVTHLDISDSQIEKTIKILKNI